ncbi:hypothetical protein [Streptomyces sp. NPDC054887]
MSFFRRTAAVSAVAVALVAGGLASTASAAPAGAPAAVSEVLHPYPPGGGPLRFGPFVFPSNGQVSGGFAWNTSNHPL